jgi:hypothetical protein
VDTPCPDSQSILQRLDRLERQNRRLRKGFVSLLVVAAGICLVAARPTAKDKTVEAERFVVVDAQGHKHAAFGLEKAVPAWESPVPGLYIYDPKGTPQLLLHADEALGGGLYLQSGDNTRLALVAKRDKMAGLVVYRDPKDRKSQIVLVYSDDGKPGLFFNDAEGTTRIGMMLEKGGKPVLSMKNQEGKVFFSQAEER